VYNIQIELDKIEKTQMFINMTVQDVIIKSIQENDEIDQMYRYVMSNKGFDVH
jgi:hypothetical protein